jgi:hypothetical protein
MVVDGFSRTPVAISYVVAQLILGLHLAHGAWSWFQSLGLNHENRLYKSSDLLKLQNSARRLRLDRHGYARFVHWFGILVFTIVVLGNCSIPLAIHLGWRPDGLDEGLFP